MKKNRKIKKESEYTKKIKYIKKNISLLILCLPGIILFIIFNYLPMAGVVLAFKNYSPRKGIFASEWVEFQNFKFFFASQDAFRTIRNTILYSIDFLIVDIFVGVTMALLLYNLKNKIGLKIYHTIILMPRFISIVVISFITYAILSPSSGLLNRALATFGVGMVQWYNKPEYWPIILNIVHIWQTAGSGCLYYYAALVGTDPALFEASSIDGANVFQKCWHIAIPCLIPIMTMMTILGIGGLFSGDMGLFYQVTMNQGALYPTTDIINTYTYRALLDGSLTKSTAVGLFQSVTGLILVLLANGIVRRKNPENSMF